MGSTVDGLRKVSYGLNLVYISIILSVLTFLIAFLAVMSLGPNPQEAVAAVDSNKSVGFAVSFFGLLSGVMAIVGKAYCLQAPQKAQASGPIFLSVAFSFLGLLITVGAQIPATAPIFGPALSFGGLLTTLGYVSFLIFLQRIAAFIGSAALSTRARSILLWSIVLAPLYLLGLLMALTQGPQQISMLLALMMLAISIAAIVLFVRYANLLRYLRKTIDYLLDQNGDQLDVD